jgi:methylmalonyl-CoA mutase
MYKAKHHIRIVTAASLFDGHDASINIMRRILQDAGAEVIHLGHNRSVSDVVKTALQEGAQGICVSSYQGGHMEYFKYMRDLLVVAGAGYVRIFGGGGGVIIHEEKAELEKYGISQIFHPDDGRRLGLEGMIEFIIKDCDFDIVKQGLSLSIKNEVKNENSSQLTLPDMQMPHRNLGLAMAEVEANNSTEVFFSELLSKFNLESFKNKKEKSPLVFGITGTGGAGKSSLIDELVQRFLNAYPDKKIAVVCVDPSKRKTGGSLLGDRIRMNSLSRDHVYMRSVASRGSGQEISSQLPNMVRFLKNLDFDLVIAETSGIGQGNIAITEISDLSLYVMTSEFGAQSQLEKIDMIDFADMVAINKADRRGSKDALRDVSKQYRRSRKIFDQEIPAPVYLTQASQFNDGGVNQLFLGLVHLLLKKESSWKLPESYSKDLLSAEEHVIIPAHRQSYLAEIVSSVRNYKKRVEELSLKASQLGALEKTSQWIEISPEILFKKSQELSAHFEKEEFEELKRWDELISKYKADDYIYLVRGKEFKQKLFSTSLSGTRIPRVATPRLTDWGDRFRFLKFENFPGEFPYAAGVFPLKREDEDPKRMFAGEGGPERTNRRFHFLCKGEKAHRLSTAFDSVTLYGHDPSLRPDIFGKVGESGVSICTLEDMKKLYADFDLCAPSTSVSMTINGPAPMILAFFFNTAIDQQVEKKEKELGRKLNTEEWNALKENTVQQVRGTVQADILKEDQGQNTCIFSIHFALKMMGDIQEYFVKNKIKNFYSVSISGYHIAEAGANPISQLAFTLSNGLTFVEYYLSRGLKIDDFAQNLSFFFSNGLDPEYSVLGRVARRVWAIIMRDFYKANDRSQKLKYHIQTSGRSLHAQEIDFNDIRTTLQALIALYDNCNSLHTNAYDEAITTPTEESVRRAMAIQMIINREFGMTKNDNPIQGAYIIEELTELVEEAVLDEFMRINERGGVLGAMETQYQRSKIQDESLHYEHLKHTGELPIVGVNTFINPKTLDPNYIPPRIELARATQQEKQDLLDRCHGYQHENSKQSKESLANLKQAALQGKNIFEALLESARYCTLYEMTEALFEVGGQYRRNI